MVSSFLVVVVALGLVSCAHSNSSALTGKKFDRSAAQKIVKGRTAKAEVIRLVGAPLTRTELGEGAERFNYFHHQASHTAAGVAGLVSPAVGIANEVAGVKERRIVRHYLFVTFDAQGIVTEVTFNDYEY